MPVAAVRPAPRLVTPFEHRVELQYAYHVITLEHAAEDERVRVFRQWLFAEAAELQKAG